MMASEFRERWEEMITDHIIDAFPGELLESFGELEEVV